MTRIRVDLRVPVGRALPDLAAFIVRCEQARFDGVGIHDHPSSGRDAYLALALACRATQRLRLFPATSSPLVRHALVLASLAHSLEEIAPGRTCLTVAPGFISTRSIGKPRARVTVMREAIRDIRKLLAGESVEFGPTPTRLRNASATPTPVYLLAAGPRMIELAGEAADGAFLMVGLHAAAIHAALRHLEHGAARAGRAGLPGGVRDHARPRIRRSGRAMGAKLLRTRSTLSRLSERIESSLVERGRVRARANARSRGDPRGSSAANCRCIRTVRPSGTLRRAPSAGTGRGRRRARVLVPRARPRARLRPAGDRGPGV